DQVGVTAVDVVNRRHERLTLGTQPGQHEAGTRPDVGGHHGGAGEALATPDNGVMSVGAHVGPEPGELVDEHEARLVHVLGDHRSTVGNRVETDDHRLEIG